MFCRIYVSNRDHSTRFRISTYFLCFDQLFIYCLLKLGNVLKYSFACKSQLIYKHSFIFLKSLWSKFWYTYLLSNIFNRVYNYFYFYFLIVLTNIYLSTDPCTCLVFLSASFHDFDWPIIISMLKRSSFLLTFIQIIYAFVQISKRFSALLVCDFSLLFLFIQLSL